MAKRFPNRRDGRGGRRVGRGSRAPPSVLRMRPIMLRPLVLAALLCAAPAAHAQVSREAVAEVDRVTASAPYKAAMAALSADHNRIVEENIALTEVPAPPFKEAAKAK